jgi:hypothetical protein
MYQEASSSGSDPDDDDDDVLGDRMDLDVDYTEQKKRHRPVVKLKVEKKISPDRPRH